MRRYKRSPISDRNNSIHVFIKILEFIVINIENVNVNLFLRVILSLIMVWVGVATIYDIVIRIIKFITIKINNPDENVDQLVVNNEQNNQKLSANSAKKESKLHQFLINSSFYTNTIKLFDTEGEIGNKVTVSYSMLKIIFFK